MNPATLIGFDLDFDDHQRLNCNLASFLFHDL